MRVPPYAPSIWRLSESKRTKTAFMDRSCRCESWGLESGLFDRALGEPFDDEALPDQQQHERGQNGERGARCHLGVLNLEILREFRNRNRHGSGLLRRERQGDCK